MIAPTTVKTVERHHDLRLVGFEFLPTEPLAAAMIFFLCIQSLGAVAALAEVILLGAILAICWRSLPPIIASGSVLLIPIFAILLTGWSGLPDVPLRYGLELLMTVLVGIAIATTVPARSLPLVVFIGTAAATLLGFACGRMGAAISGEVLIGLTGSKNQMAYVSLFWLTSSLCVAGSGRYRWAWRLAALISTVPATYLIWQSESATVIVTAAIAFLVLLSLVLTYGLPRGTRPTGLVSVAVVGLGATRAAAPQLERYVGHVRADILDKGRRLHDVERMLALPTETITAPRIFAALALLMIAIRMRTELVFGPLLLDAVLLSTVLTYAVCIKIGSGPHHSATPVLLASRRHAIATNERKYA